MNLIQGELSVNSSYKVGVVTSRFNPQVTEPLELGALQKLKQLGIEEDNILRVRVPGALEIPLAVQSLLEAGCLGVVALGAVIRGETTHYDYVCSGAERGCSELQLRYKKPVSFGVLTTENSQQALDRVGGKKGHKGEEAAEVLIEMINLTKELENK